MTTQTKQPTPEPGSLKHNTIYPPTAPHILRAPGEPWWRYILSTYTTRFVRESCYAFTAGTLGFGTFLMLPIGFSVGAGLLVTLIGFPILILTMYLWRGATWLAGWHNWLYTLKKPTQPKYRSTPREAGLWQRLKTDVTDPQTWVSFGAILAHVVTSFAAWCGAMIIWCMLLVPIGVGLGHRSGRWHMDDAAITFADRAYYVDDPQYMTFAVIFTGIMFLIGPWLIRALAHLHFVTFDVCVNAWGRTRHEVANVKQSRAKARASQSEALRRLERNIHDGPQQQLVRVGMDLHRAHKNVTTDPNKTSQILADTIVRVDQTLLELRDISRGIAPPVLADRGLEAAINELATRSDIPVDVTFNVSKQLPYYTEETAYFVISEGLVNTNKHSAARQIHVTATDQQTSDTIIVTVHDNGTGGASVSKGHGLAGLIQRVEAADGTLEVTSPAGGPTTLKAVIPCEW